MKRCNLSRFLMFSIIIMMFVSCKKEKNESNLPLVKTVEVSNIDETTVTCGGNIASDGNSKVTERGVCWSAVSNATILGNHTSDGSGIGSFTSNISGLTGNMTYYVRAYATNSVGTAYGEEKVFKTKQTNNSLPTVSSATVSNISSTTATCGGNVTSDGNSAVTAKGVCWSTSQNPTIANNKTNNGQGLGAFTSNITGLTTGTTYYVRAYATNSNGTSYGEQRSFTTIVPIGAISGIFSISSSKHIFFSKGNLQYKASTNTWRFAENQYDIVGSNNSNISSTYSAWVDLFGWGMSGYDNQYPWSTHGLHWDYPNIVDIIGLNYDWGINNAIENGANIQGLWHALSAQEWTYLLEGRNNAINKWGCATVNGKNGFVILPDEWILPSTCSFIASASVGLNYNHSGYYYDNSHSNHFTDNIYSINQWILMENNGAVFLPIAGIRRNYEVSDINSIGNYWTTTTDMTSSPMPQLLYIDKECIITRSINYSWEGCSVRLVQNL